jgi:hypothetical protein
MELVKDRSILTVLAKLRRRLGSDAFQVVDDWDADLFALGIAHPEEPRLLVYISTYQHPNGRYSVSLESPPAPGASLLYEPGGEHELLDFEELVEVVVEHLKVPEAPRRDG